MAVTTSTRLGITRWSAGTDPFTRAQTDADHATLDDLVAISLQGTAAARPAPTIRGRIYYATDTGAFSYDTGSAWAPIQNTLTYGSPSAETVGAVGADGVSANIARADHVHAMPGFGAVTSEITYGIAAANGTATTIARSDHTHGSPPLGSTAATTSAVGDVAAVGTGTAPARSDHVHGREGFGAVTAATSFGQASANGTAVTVARSDHTHGSPSLSGVAATTSAVGDAAAIGSATTAAKADHVHGREAFGATTAETAFGQAVNSGVATTLARSDHTHGTPATPVTSWAGRTGVVTATAADIGAGTFPVGSFIIKANTSGIPLILRAADTTPGDLQQWQDAATNMVAKVSATGVITSAGLTATGNITENGNRVYSAGNTPPYPVTSVASRTGAVTLAAADIAAGTFPAGAFTFTGNLSVGGTLDSTGVLSEAGNRVYSAGNAPPYPVTTVAGRTGAVALTAADIAAGSFPAGGAFTYTGDVTVSGASLVLGYDSGPPAGSSSSVVVYSSNTGRLKVKDGTGTTYDAGNSLTKLGFLTIVGNPVAVATTAATTTVDPNGYLTWTGIQPGVYVYELDAAYSLGATTAALRAATNFTGTASSHYTRYEAQNSPTAVFSEVWTTNNNFALSNMGTVASASILYPLTIRGYLNVTAVGDLQFRFGASVSTTLSIYGLVMRLTRVA